MFEQVRWSRWSLAALAAGFVWLSASSGAGFWTSLPLWLFGSAFVATGISQLLWPGDLRINAIGALAGLLGTVVALPYVFGLGFFVGALLLATSVGAFWTAGRMAIELEPHVPGVPVPRPTPGLVTKVAFDDAILGFEQFQTAGFALDGTLERVISEVQETHALFLQRGLLEKPETYHLAPPDLVDPEIRTGEIRGHRVETLRFESGYAPADGEPGRARWLGYDPCREGYAYVMRHDGPPRPWMICTNGYRMGHAKIDVGLFERFHVANGLNVAIPVLPLHGPRKLGLHSGSGFMGVDVIDTIHAEAQAMWDMRRILSWVRAQEAPSVGAFGLSLGGYTTALFASLADGLACAIPGIPLADFSRAVTRHGAAHQIRYAQHIGYDLDQIRDVLKVVSPLTLTPRVPLEGRMIFGANADRLVTPDQVQDLWRHWEEPEIVWYAGSHISFMNERDVWNGVDRTLRDSGVVFGGSPSE